MQSSSLKEETFAISPEIQALAESEKLGVLRKVYSISKRNTSHFGVGLLCLVFGLITAPFLFTPSHPPIIVVPGIILLIIGGYLVFSQRMYSRMASRWHIYLWQHGLLYEKGQKRQVLRWDQIDAIHRNSDPRYFTCKIRRQDGSTFRLSTAFSDRNQLIDILFEEFVRQCAPPGLIIAPPTSIKKFTYLKLDRQGINSIQGTLSWQEIQEFTTYNGEVMILKKALSNDTIFEVALIDPEQPA